MRTTHLGRRARLLPLLVAAIALLVACVPVPPPPPAPPQYQTQYCSGGTPLVASQYQAQHDGLRTVNTDFGAGDGGAPVALPDGRTLWIFADTWTGYIRNNAMADPYHLVHNAFVVQSGGCLTPVMGGSHGARTDLIPAPPGQFSWPMGAFVDGTTLSVFVERYLPAANLCGCQALGIDIARFSLPGLTLLDRRPSPTGMLLPEFGSAVFTAGGFHYLVGRSDPTGLFRDRQYLARLPVGTDPVTTPWEYWNGGTTGGNADWSLAGATTACVRPTAPASPGTGGACPMLFEMPASAGTVTGPDGPGAPLWVLPRTDGSFVASAKLHDATADPIETWRADRPEGPWLAPTFAASTPAPAGGFTYSGRVFQLPGAAPTAQFSTNGPDNDHHTDVYRVVFASPTFPYP